MSVIVKGMEMPNTCGECHFLHNEGFYEWCCLTGSDDYFYDSRPYSCPLVNIPSGHGRLIDADNAKEVMLFEMSGTGYQSTACSILKSDLYTPTILEAESGE